MSGTTPVGSLFVYFFFFSLVYSLFYSQLPYKILHVFFFPTFLETVKFRAAEGGQQRA